MAEYLERLSFLHEVQQKNTYVVEKISSKDEIHFGKKSDLLTRKKSGKGCKQGRENSRELRMPPPTTSSSSW
jgi:hypothetical protein